MKKTVEAAYIAAGAATNHREGFVKLTGRVESDRGSSDETGAQQPIGELDSKASSKDLYHVLILDFTYMSSTLEGCSNSLGSEKKIYV